MSETQTSAVCPGQRALLPNAGGAVYLRVSVFVCWDEASPSKEFFYLHEWPLVLTLAGISALENTLHNLMADYWQTNRIKSAQFDGYMAVELSPGDVASLGWQVVTGTAA